MGTRAGMRAQYQDETLHWDGGVPTPAPILELGFDPRRRLPCWHLHQDEETQTGMGVRDWNWGPTLAPVLGGDPAPSWGVP